MSASVVSVQSFQVSQFMTKRQWAFIAQFVSSGVLLLAIFLCLIIPSSAAADETVERGAVFSSHISADRTTFIYFSDIAPTIRRLLTAPRVVKLISSMPDSGRGLTAKSMLRSFEDSAVDYVPDQICLAISETGIDNLARIIPASMCLGLCSGAIASGENEALDEIHPILIDHLKNIRLSDIDLWVRFREESLAEIFEQQVLAAMPEIAEELGVEIEFEEHGMSVDLRLGDFVPAELIAGVLFSMNMTDDLGDPNLKVASGLIADKSLKLRVRRIGAAVLVQLGDINAVSGKTLDPKSGDLWTEDADLLLYTRYQSKPVRARSIEASELWNKYKDHPIGKTVLEMDTDDLLGDLNDLTSAMGDADCVGEFRALLNQQLIVDSRESGHAETASLQDSGILSFVPASASAWVLSSESSLGEVVKGTLSDFEDRLSTQMLKYGDEDGTPRSVLLNQINDFYYIQLREFRRLIRDESTSVFVAPVGLIVGSEPTMESFTAQFEYDGDVNRIAFDQLSMKPMAIVAKLSPDAELEDYLATVQRAFFGAWKDLPELKLTRQTQLDGIPGTVEAISGDWQSKVLPYDITISSNGSALLHGLVTQDDWLILSTSPEMTRDILEAAENPKKRMTISPTQAQGSLVTQATGTMINDTILLPLRWIGKISSTPESITTEGDVADGIADIWIDGQARDVAKVISGMTYVIEGIDEIMMESSIEAGTRVFHSSMSFRE